MSDLVRDQYEAFPYPERDPADEARRLVTGSPSRPEEIDHFVFGGQRDWSRPLRALVAGGGTGDGLIQLAQKLADAGRPFEITYLDLSRAARTVAEERARVRGLTGITFLTGSLMATPGLGPFDYIDCCGVLHHLEDPVAGARALAASLAPGGGIGFMVYAPFGRSGVYPLQEAYETLLGHLPPAEKLREAKAIQARLPAGHPFRTNPNLSDHRASDAGFFDLLLHSRDRAFDVAGLLDLLREAGLTLAGFCQPVLYDPSRFATRPAGMDDATAWAVAEKLAGTIKTHVGYAVPVADARPAASWEKGDAVPVLQGDRIRVAAQVARTGRLPLRLEGCAGELRLPKEAARLIAAVTGRNTLSEIALAAGLSDAEMKRSWPRIGPPLTHWGLLHYSTVHRPQT